MKKAALRNLTIGQLVERFKNAALKQDQALLMNDIGKVNRLFDELEEIEAELKARDDDQRGALLQLYDHPNAQVQVKAAKATLAVVPVEARQKLKSIRESGRCPQAGEAGMSLRALEKGIFKPT